MNLDRDSQERGLRMLLRQIEIFLRETGMPWTRFGRLAAHDPRFVGDLRNGRMPRADTQERIERFMRAWKEKTDAN